MNAHVQLLLLSVVVFLVLPDVHSMKVRLPNFRRRRPVGGKPGRGKGRDRVPVFLKLSTGDAVPVFPVGGGTGGPQSGGAQGDPIGFQFPGGLPSSEGSTDADAISFSQPENIQAKLSSMMPANFDEGVFGEDFGSALPEFPDLSSIFDDSASFSARLDEEDQEEQRPSYDDAELKRADVPLAQDLPLPAVTFRDSPSPQKPLQAQRRTDGRQSVNGKPRFSWTNDRRGPIGNHAPKPRV